jgi:hypothetical protein
MLPEPLRLLLMRVRRRRRLRTIAEAMTVGGALFVAIVITTTTIRARINGAAIAGAAIIGAVAAVVIVTRRWRTSAATLAEVVEAADGTLDNLIATAAQLEEKPRPVRAEIRDAILEQAASRAARVDAAAVVPLAQPLGVAAAIALGCLLLAGTGGDAPLTLSGLDLAGSRAANASGAMTILVAPPSYTKRAAETHVNPVQLTVMAGTRIRIEADARVLREWTATASESLDVRVGNDVSSRFLSVVVVPDAPPSVRIVEPGRDTAFTTPGRTLAIGVESSDDLGLVSLALRYTKASGGGENVTFTDGEVPLTVEHVSERQWRGRAQWPLDGLGLADGDVLVYRAVARDANPSGAPVESDAFLVEIGRTAEIASAGFALPSEERKYAISQQMVIYKTEQLLAAGPAAVSRDAGASGWIERSREIGMEQRMVRAEVVFLSGGDVQDEVEEAQHSHELAEGRLENQGRAEMLRAINFMSRAEAQLNDGNAAGALPLERQALASLERALDRRRYFLRTLPDRSRIDITRRLTGERREARSWTRVRAPVAANAAERSQAVIAELIAALTDGSRVDASLAARVAGVDPGSPDLQKAAVGVADAQTADQRREAVQTALRAVTAHALKTVPGSWPVTLPVDPLAGRLGEALAPSRTPR